MNSLLKFIDRAYQLFLKAMNALQSPLLLVIRLYWGWQFWQSGLPKLQDVPTFAEKFASWGIPHPYFMVYFIGLLETVGGILLILGLGSRLIALPLLIDMIAAYVTADREALRTAFSSDNTQFLNAAPFSFLCASLLILIFGPGWFSLDTIIKWYRAHKKKSAATSSA